MGVGDFEEADVALGRELRRIRKTRGLSLEEVATKTGLSLGLISQVERGITSPSIRSLRLLAAALDLPASWFFHTNQPDRDERTGCIVRATNRRYLRLAKIGVAKELLTPQQNAQLQMMLIFLDPGGSTGPEPTSHQGEKCGLVLSGSIELNLDGKSFTVQEGDSFGFESTRPHFIVNSGANVARVLWVTTPPIY